MSKLDQKTQFFLTFKLEDKMFGLNVKKIQNILEMTEIAIGLKDNDIISGVIKLKDKNLPVLNLRKKFGMPPANITDKNCIIVVETEENHHHILTGLLVDEIREVIEINSSEINPISSMPILQGACNSGGKTVSILKNEGFFTDEDLEMIKKSKIINEFHYKKVFVF